MDADFCILALEGALAKYGKPDIFNSDQGSQFTSFALPTSCERMASADGSSFTTASGPAAHWTESPRACAMANVF